jgi:hypothetical protein
VDWVLSFVPVIYHKLNDLKIKSEDEHGNENKKDKVRRCSEGKLALKKNDRQQ